MPKQGGGDPFAISQFLLPPSFEASKAIVRPNPFSVPSSSVSQFTLVAAASDEGEGAGRRAEEERGREEEGGERRKRPSVFKAAITAV